MAGEVPFSVTRCVALCGGRRRAGSDFGSGLLALFWLLVDLTVMRAENGLLAMPSRPPAFAAPARLADP